MRYQITCIRKRSDAHAPHERIEGLGSQRWYDAASQIIKEIEAGTNSYYVVVGGQTSEVVVAEHEGRKYLKTSSDGYPPENLLALPLCHA